MDSSTATLRRSLKKTPGSTAQAGAAPQGLGASLGAVAPASGRGQRLLRQATLAKGYGHMKHNNKQRGPSAPAALPLFDVSVAVLQSLDDLRTTDTVLASTLHVPAHHVMACRAEAYGTPFSAPALQTLAEANSLTDDDKEFAACLAAPPEMEEVEQLSVQHRLIRMASLARMQQPTQLVQQAQQQEQRQEQQQETKLQQLLQRDASVRRARAAPATRARSGADNDDLDEALRRAESALRAQSGVSRDSAYDALSRGQQSGPALLLAASGNPVGALVGLGALLVRGFGELAQREVERRAATLMRVDSLVRADSLVRLADRAAASGLRQKSRLGNPSPFAAGDA